MCRKDFVYQKDLQWLVELFWKTIISLLTLASSASALRVDYKKSKPFLIYIDLEKLSLTHLSRNYIANEEKRT